MEYTATLMNDNRVRISIVKTDEIDIERIKKMADEKMFMLDSMKELKTKVHVISKPIKNKHLAVVNYPFIFITAYKLLNKLTPKAVKQIEKFLNEKIKELESKK